MADEKKAAKKAEKAEKAATVDVNAFIARKMKALNEMENKAKARELAKRLIMNKRGN